jgi:hypothetical protein
MENHPPSHYVQLSCLVIGGSPCSTNKALALSGRGISCCELHNSLPTDDFHITGEPVLPSDVYCCSILSVIYHDHNPLYSMKNAVFWGVMPCYSCMNRPFGGNIASITRVERASELVTASAVTSSEMFASKTATRCNIPEDGIAHTHRRENLKSYGTVVHICHTRSARNVQISSICMCRRTQDTDMSCRLSHTTRTGNTSNLPSLIDQPNSLPN